MSNKNKVETVADRLHSAAIHLLRWVRTQDETLGLTPARLSAMSVVVFGGPVGLNKLAQIEQVKPPTMVRIVDGLEELGLVERTVDAGDRRAVIVRGTSKGITLLKKGRRKRVQYLCRKIKDLTAPDLRHLEEASRIIQQIVGY